VLARVRLYSLTSNGPSSTSSDTIYILSYIGLLHFISNALSVIPVRQVCLPKIHTPCVRCVLHASTMASCFDLINPNHFVMKSLNYSDLQSTSGCLILILPFILNCCISFCCVCCIKIRPSSSPSELLSHCYNF